MASQLKNAIVTILRQATKRDTPVTIRKVMDSAAVKKLTDNEPMVRAKVTSPVGQQLAIKHELEGGGVGYTWADLGKIVEEKPEKAPPKQKIKPIVVPSGDVELVVEGITVVIGKNPSTGRLRIVVE